MKNFKLIALIAAILIAGSFFRKSHSQISVEKFDNSQIVYWFYINVRLKENVQSGYTSYEVLSLGSRISHGALKKYNRTLWKYLSSGTKFTVGPFRQFKEAQQAQYFYDNKEETIKLDSTFNKSKTLYWFMLRVKRRPRSQSFELEKIPGAVGSGNYSNFWRSYKAALPMKSLPIGPFWNHQDAEEAKRQYRLQ